MERKAQKNTSLTKLPIKTDNMTQIFKSSFVIAIAIFIGCISLYASNNVTEIAIAEHSDTDGYTEIKIVENTDSVIAVCESDEVDTPPEYKGGQDGLIKFLGENITYPAECAENEIEGRVTVKFVVLSDGKVGFVEVINSAHPLLDAEAVRVISLMDEWIPGKLKGEAVNVYFTLPVSFKLQNQERIEAQIKAKEWEQFYGLAQEAEQNGNIAHAIAYYWECFDINPQITSSIESILHINNGETRYGTNLDILNKAYQLLKDKEQNPFNKQSYNESLDWICDKIYSLDPKALKQIEQNNDR